MDIQKNGLEVLRVERTSYKGKQYIGCRVYVPSKDDGETLLPTKKGVTLTPDLARQAGLEMARLADEIEPENGDEG